MPISAFDRDSLGVNSLNRRSEATAEQEEAVDRITSFIFATDETRMFADLHLLSMSIRVNLYFICGWFQEC